MSRDDPDAEATVDTFDEDALAEEMLDDSDLEPPQEELEAEELGVGGLEDPDTDDAVVSDISPDDSDDAKDDVPARREVPAGVRASDDEDDDDDEDEELEADLGEILKERLASEDDDDDDDEDDDIGIVSGSRSTSKQEDEILCEGCFLLVKLSQFDTRSPEPTCPHCGTPIAV